MLSPTQQSVVSPTSASPVPYTVRNTFIDLPRDPSEGPLFESVFGTWPISRHPVADTTVAADVEEGEIGEEAEEISANDFFGLGALVGSCDRRKPSSLEDGEIPEDGEVSEDEVEMDVSRPSEATEIAAGGTPAAAGVQFQGSTAHDRRECRPCAWMHKGGNDGCRNGDSCDYCHLCPPGELRRRKREKLQRRFFGDIATVSDAAASTSSSSARTPSAAVMPSMALTLACSPTLSEVLDMEPCYIEMSSLPGAVPAWPSVGSFRHGSGHCRPCAWIHKDPAVGCKNGSSCKYCHMCPAGEIKRRKRDKWAMRIVEAEQKKAERQSSYSSPPPQ
eukprot:TRINITY_DN75809_c0_g1_i1.p1 TRINITY_DN75809_c0_g1~~TRINITY_DN75809_c0_g1_i1.p1  ORF type:complete len:333 (-),score=55.25 TRINITY_DN75809_c0_g1_i1:28-1026(-)